MDPLTLTLFVLVVLAVIAAAAALIVVIAYAVHQTFLLPPILRTFQISGQFLCQGCEFKLNYEFAQLAWAAAVLCEIIEREERNEPRGAGMQITNMQGPVEVTIGTGTPVALSSGAFEIRLFVGDQKLARLGLFVVSANEITEILVNIIGTALVFADGTKALITAPLQGDFKFDNKPDKRQGLGLCSKTIITAITFEAQTGGAIGGDADAISELIFEGNAFAGEPSRRILATNVSMGEQIDIEPEIIVGGQQALSLTLSRPPVAPPFVDDMTVSFTATLEILCQP